MPAQPLAAFESLIGQTVTIEGRVLSSGESRSGQTRYLNFANRPGVAISLAFRTSEADHLFPLSRLQSLHGQVIRATGKVTEVHGSLLVFISHESDLQIVP